MIYAAQQPLAESLAEATAESQDEKANFLSSSLRKRFLPNA